ncbi:hypothetical protein MSAN_00176000 [Mycena sanguinolenta]|uniref:Uncharacterized protein n=1 Tax=Mycena sanguinolenta TaxID=230812 RepID=A0A8H6ZEH2_9AGAR|nr:hypothetical protein MSAN_00176000 [Mycena sanguinolenta]
MPFFPSSSGFQIYDSNFYDVAGDMNIHSTQPAIALGRDPLTALESGLTATTYQPASQATSFGQSPRILWAVAALNGGSIAFGPFARSEPV